jgi:hypothetical protein
MQRAVAVGTLTLNNRCLPHLLPRPADDDLDSQIGTYIQLHSHCVDDLAIGNNVSDYHTSAGDYNGEKELAD